MGEIIPIKYGDTTMIDIYEAAGGTANEDRTQISFDPSQLHPFDIVVRVYPGTIQQEANRDPLITFDIPLDDEMSIEREAWGSVLRHIEHEAALTLPVSQVRILRKETK